MNAEKILALYNEMNNFGRLMNMHFEVIQPGEIIYHINITEDHLATRAVAHGGALAGYMDAILGVAALSSIGDEGKLVSTIEFKITYLAPAHKGDNLKGLGKVIKKGKRMVFAEGEIINQNDEVIAKATGTFIAYPVEKMKGKP